MLMMLKVSDEMQITELLRAYGATLKSRSLPNVLSLFTIDGVLMAPGFTPAAGSIALKSSYERIFSTIRLEIEFSIDEIVVMSNGQWAFARTTASGTKHWLEKGTQENHHNQEIFICQKVENVWKIARYCFSSMKKL